ncbi:MAG: hypothetical protein COC01_09340 [Bacteroidetes bacterium]|nr:MAG: hypothetical protein COC01_09340 [Bacteroidota bacterium]
MKPSLASLLNGLILISLGLWGYFGSETRPLTALIPVIIGVILLLLNKGVRNENKVIAHIAVVLTFLILLGLIMPFLGAFARSNNAAIIRVGIMMFSTIVAMMFFIKSFINARKSREN